MKIKRIMKCKQCTEIKKIYSYHKNNRVNCKRQKPNTIQHVQITKKG